MLTRAFGGYGFAKTAHGRRYAVQQLGFGMLHLALDSIRCFMNALTHLCAFC